MSLKFNENYLNIPSVSTTERISKLKGRMQELDAMKVGNVGANSQLW